MVFFREVDVNTFALLRRAFALAAILELSNDLGLMRLSVRLSLWFFVSPIRLVHRIWSFPSFVIAIISAEYHRLSFPLLISIFDPGSHCALLGSLGSHRFRSALAPLPLLSRLWLRLGGEFRSPFTRFRPPRIRLRRFFVSGLSGSSRGGMPLLRSGLLGSWCTS